MRLLLLILTALVTLTAIPSGFMMMYNPDGSSLELTETLLEHSPFPNFFIPGLLLVTVVGGTHLFALFLIMDNHPGRFKTTLAAGLVLIAWITVQALFLQSFHWLHGLYLSIGILTTLSSYQLMGKAAI